jgi:hypothetical protein
MDLREMVEGIVREVVTEVVGDVLGKSSRDVTEPTDSDSDTPRRGRQTQTQTGARVTYWLTKAGKRANASKDLRGNNKRVFAVIGKREGLTKRQIWEKVKDHVSTPKSAESNIYQLQNAGLVESRENGD